MPPTLSALEAGVFAPGADVGQRLLAIARPGVCESDGLRARHVVLERLARCEAVRIDQVDGTSNPALAVAQALFRDPADATSLTEWACEFHVSAKTLQRNFEREFDTTFTAWRTATRMRAAAAMLRDLSVTDTAHRVGYASTSAFVAAFTRQFGTTPGRSTSQILGDTAPRPPSDTHADRPKPDTGAVTAGHGDSQICHHSDAPS